MLLWLAAASDLYSVALQRIYRFQFFVFLVTQQEQKKLKGDERLPFLPHLCHLHGAKRCNNLLVDLI